MNRAPDRLYHAAVILCVRVVCTLGPSTSPELGRAEPAELTAVSRGSAHMLSATHVVSVATVIRREVAELDVSAVAAPWRVAGSHRHA
jgi:hypothetical protein